MSVLSPTHGLHSRSFLRRISFLLCLAVLIGQAIGDDSNGELSADRGEKRCQWQKDKHACPAAVTGGPQCDGFMDEGKLILLQAVFRNGDRAPLSPYPMDPWKHPWNWPMGIGQLTPVGRRKMVCLGEWLTATYHSFFCERFYNFTLHGMRSSDTRRTRTSADLLLMSMFPPPGGVSTFAVDTAPSNLYHVQTKPCAEDSVLRADVKCPAADEEEERIRRVNHHFKKAHADYYDVKDALFTNTGYPAKMDFLKMAGKVYDTLRQEEKNQFCLPQWTYGLYPESLCELAGLDMFTQSMGMNIRRLRAGPLVTYLASNMKNKVGMRSSIQPDWTACHRKFYGFATHARVLANVLGAFGYTKTHVPSFGAAILVELRQIDSVPTGACPYFVKVVYKDANQIRTLQIPGCDCLCPLTTFERYLEDNGLDITPLGFRQECPACKDGKC